MHMGIAIAPLQQCNLVCFGEPVSSACMQQTLEVGNRSWRRVQRTLRKLQVKRSCRQRVANPGGRSRATTRQPIASLAAPRRQRPLQHRKRHAYTVFPVHVIIQSPYWGAGCRLAFGEMNFGSGGYWGNPSRVGERRSTTIFYQGCPPSMC